MLAGSVLSKTVPMFSTTFSPFFRKVNITNIALENLGMRDKLYKSIELEIKGCERAVLTSYESFVKTAAGHLDINIEKTVTPAKPNLKRFTVCKSIMGHRKHMVQYEIRTHYCFIYLQNLTGSTADTFLEYIERMLPEGVGLKVTKVCLEPLPSHLKVEDLPETLMQKQTE